MGDVFCSNVAQDSKLVGHILYYSTYVTCAAQALIVRMTTKVFGCWTPHVQRVVPETSCTARATLCSLLLR